MIMEIRIGTPPEHVEDAWIMTSYLWGNVIIHIK